VTAGGAILCRDLGVFNPPCERRTRRRADRRAPDGPALGRTGADVGDQAGALRFPSVKRINCVCGSVVEGDDDDELWENAQQHLHADHPDLVGTVSRDDILAQAEEM
jgi:hypothetical protein